jgi:hypothetical protein
MRLLEYKSNGELTLTKDLINRVPPYAILSHTWGADIDEVTFQDLIDGTGQSKPGYDKIRFCGRQARSDGLQYFWVDTCFIDKSNNTELSEAINSMFRWYRYAAKCYVYLQDVSRSALNVDDKSTQLPWIAPLRESRWFTRGWTLQELIAPISVEFFSRDGEQLGDKKSLELYIHEITGIPIKALQGSPLSDFSVIERISWAEKREATRKEDMAYSLLGILGIHMPLIYGEGREYAFKRLRKEIQNRAIDILPSINQAISDLSDDPMRSVALTIRSETIPEDPDVILELRLKIDDLFHGTMSFFIARYREGRTWPDGYGLRELDYTEFFLSLRPRLDVQLKWFGRIVQLQPLLGDGELVDRPALLYSTVLDGAEFKPGGSLSHPQVFEIPSLRTLIRKRSTFQLVTHNVLTKAVSVVSDDTDISIELKGELQGDWLQLYRSHTTKEQRDLLTIPYLSPPGMSPILRNALLARYCYELGITQSDSYMLKLKLPSADDIEKNEFDSREERIIAASYFYDNALLSFARGRWRDSFIGYKKTYELLLPLTLTSPGIPPVILATALYLSLRCMAKIWGRLKSLENAKMVSRRAINAVRRIKNSDPTDPDFQGMWANALLQDASINADLQDGESTIECLVEHVNVLRSLYLKIQTQPRRLAWLASLLNAVKIVSTNKISADKEVDAWKAALRAEIGDDEAFNKAAHQPSPDKLPVWLTDCRLELWPTGPIQSATLRYTLRIPEWWNAEFTTRGTTSETMHIYDGGVGGYDSE